MTRRSETGRIPNWTDQVKTQIARRYRKLAEASDLKLGGADRARDAGYPEDLLSSLPAEITDRYSGCGYPLAAVNLSGVKVAVDLGCGAGLDVWALAGRLSQDAIVLGLDLAPEMLLRVFEAVDASDGATVMPVAGDMECLPFASEIADLVMANASFNLTLDKKLAFTEVGRILRPGGQLVVQDLIHEGKLPTELAQDPAAWNTSLGGVPTQSELYDAVCLAGFESVRIVGHKPFPPVTSVRLEAHKSN